MLITVNGESGGTVSNVLDNDTLNGESVDPSDVVITSTPTGPLTVNPDGSVDVAPGTSDGTYYIQYTICEVLNPTNCDTATVTVVVTSVIAVLRSMGNPEVRYPMCWIMTP
jgi:hypothetical protein